MTWKQLNQERTNTLTHQFIVTFKVSRKEVPKHISNCYAADTFEELE